MSKQEQRADSLQPINWAMFLLDICCPRFPNKILAPDSIYITHLKKWCECDTNGVMHSDSVIFTHLQYTYTLILNNLTAFGIIFVYDYNATLMLIWEHQMARSKPCYGKHFWQVYITFYSIPEYKTYIGCIISHRLMSQICNLLFAWGNPILFQKEWHLIDSFHRFISFDRSSDKLRLECESCLNILRGICNGLFIRGNCLHFYMSCLLIILDSSFSESCLGYGVFRPVISSMLSFTQLRMIPISTVQVIQHKSPLKHLQRLGPSLVWLVNLYLQCTNKMLPGSLR